MNNIIKRLGRSAKVFKSAAIAFTLKALLLGLVCQESQAFTASPTPRMSIAEYLVTRAQLRGQGFYNKSPFSPQVGYDPAPMLDFQPFGAPPKDAAKTAGEIANSGYLIYQSNATQAVDYVLYDPVNGSYYGEEHWGYTWDVARGYHLEGSGWNWLDGDWTYDTGWTWQRVQNWERERCGNSVCFRANYPHGSGYRANRYHNTSGVWKLRNVRNQTQPGFEVMVEYSVYQWPYGWHKWTATENSALNYQRPAQVFCVRPNATEDITPYFIPRNYELTADRDGAPSGGYPWLKLDLRGLADNNEQLPEWVEGHASDWN